MSQTRIERAGYSKSYPPEIIELTENSRNNAPELNLLKDLFWNLQQFRIIDLCSGTGRLTSVLAPHCSKIWAVDGSINMQKFLKVRLLKLPAEQEKKVEIILGDMCEIQFPDKIDLIIISDGSFGYLLNKRDQDTVLRKSYRALKNEGFLLISIFNPIKRIIVDKVNSNKWIREEFDNGVMKVVQYRKSICENSWGIVTTFYKNILYKNNALVNKFNFKMRIRLNRCEELIKMFKRNNFLIHSAYSDYNKTPLHRDSDYIFILKKDEK